MRKVIINSTPLIILSGIGRLDLLKKLYREVTIPEAVYREVTAKNRIKIGKQDMKELLEK